MSGARTTGATPAGTATPAATAAPAGPVDTARGRAPALDGMRALAALLVIALHVGIYTAQVASSWLGIGEGGPLGPVLSRFTVGVPIFFVLSGLLLYRPHAHAARDGGPPPSTGRYLWHRVLRILPAYWAAALVALVWFQRDQLTEVWPVVRTLLLLHIYEAGAIPLGITQTWSLATEVAFYALLPLLALALRPLLRGRSRAWAFPLALGALEAVTVVSIVLTHRPSVGPYPLPQLWLPEYLGFFAAGIGLAALASRPTALGALIARRPWASWGVALAAYVLVSTPLTGTTARYPTIAEALLEHALYLVVAVGLIAPLVLRPDAGPAPLLGRRLPAWLGRISYGLFLWHMVVVEGWLRITGEQAGTASFAVLFPLTVVLSVALAQLSYVLIERPAHRLRGIRPGRRLRRRPPGRTVDPGAPAGPVPTTPDTTRKGSEGHDQPAEPTAPLGR